MISNLLSRFLLLAVLAGLFVSCGDIAETHQTANKNTKILRLNFNQNIFSTDPNRAKTDAEVFLKNICFEPLVAKKDGVPNRRIFKKYAWDSLNNVLSFEIESGIKFHNGKQLSSQHLRDLFKRCLQHKNESASVHRLFSAVQGWPLTRWLIENRNITDSLPAGFVFTKNRFSIRFKRNTENGLALFRSLDISLTLESAGIFYGTGPFQLKSRDSDIYYDLERNPGYPKTPSNIEEINIRFIKNPSTELHDFLNGSLDMIRFNPLSIDSSERHEKLNAIIRNKYAPYLTTKTNMAHVSYLQFIPYADSTIIVQILRKYDLPNDHWIMKSMTTGQKSFLRLADLKFESESVDSLKSRFALVDTASNPSSSMLQDSLSINKNLPSVENSHQKTAIIVLDEKQIDYYQAFDAKKLVLDLDREINQGLDKRTTFIVVLAVRPAYLITNKSLKGMQNYMDFSLYVDRLYFESPKTY